MEMTLLIYLCLHQKAFWNNLESPYFSVIAMDIFSLVMQYCKSWTLVKIQVVGTCLIQDIYSDEAFPIWHSNNTLLSDYLIIPLSHRRDSKDWTQLLNMSNLFIKAPKDGDSKAPQATSASLSVLISNSNIWFVLAIA